MCVNLYKQLLKDLCSRRIPTIYELNKKKEDIYHDSAQCYINIYIYIHTYILLEVK